MWNCNVDQKICLDKVDRKVQQATRKQSNVTTKQPRTQKIYGLRRSNVSSMISYQI